VVPAGSEVKTLGYWKGKRVGSKLCSIEYLALGEVSGIENIGYKEISLLLEGLVAGDVDAIVYAQPMVHYSISK